MREVWGDAFVTDEVLSHAVWELRKAFGDEAKNPRYIHTISKKGYRLLAEVSFSTAPEPLATGSRIAQYEILEPVAGGAMGEVYKARDLRLGRVVALKFLPADLCRDQSARRRFLREAQAVALLDHPNVATIHDTGESEGGRVFLALAFYEGETLEQKLESGPLPLAEAVGIACQIAKGLAAAHRRQIVHRDIKPANVAVCPDGTVKILDFGLAKMTGATTLTRLGSSPGTPAYKSPEQTRGEKVDPRSDLWALGVVLYQMVTGRIPFGGEYEQAVIYAILNEQPRPLDDGTPAELGAVIDKALAKDAAERYQAAEEMEAALAGVPLEAGEIVRRKPVRARRRRSVSWKWLSGGLAALVVFGVVLGVWYLKKQRWDFSSEVTRLMEQGDRQEWRGDTKRILGNAESTYRKALLLNPENPLIKAQLAALLCRLESQFPEPSRRQKIRRLVEEAVTHAPDEPMPWVAQARLLLLESKPKEAESAARKAVELGPDFDRGYTMLGEALLAQGRQDEGLKELQRGVEVGQGYLRARLALAFRLKSASRLDEAAVEYRKVLAYDPDHPTAKHNLAAIYLESGRYLDALRLFREVYEETGDPRSANSLGLVYIYLDRMPEAIKTLGEAYRLEPDPTTARNLAECYEKIGQKEEARRWYEIALSGFDHSLALGGSRAYILYSRSFCAAKLGRYDEALRNIQEAMAAMPNQSSFLFRLAQIHAIAGHREEVYTYLRRAVEEGYPREDLRNDFVLQVYRDDPRFRAILESTVVR
ncbi:MAG: eukaryotic-like serine/threonine-protein kinase [Acidobacteriota bacterium]|jgi:serine/threonine-protein kinase|nr:eukaryotic-like serine/threonine-protein kinase [Acidobacteriota bacterium]